MNDETRKEAVTQTILEEAAEITSGARHDAYGHPLQNHGNTAKLWSAYLERRFTDRGAPPDLDERDVCMLMVLLKVSRDAHWRQRDNLVDIAGYARNVEMSEESGAARTGADVVHLDPFDLPPPLAMPGEDDLEAFQRKCREAGAQ